MKDRAPTPLEIYRNLLYWFAIYIKGNPIDSVNRHNHMNAFGDSIENVLLGTVNPARNSANKGKAFSANSEDVDWLLSNFTAEVDITKIKGVAKIDLLHLLTDLAKQKLEHFHSLENSTLDQDGVDALLVDFINFVGVRMGVDYAMYTNDLYEQK